MAIVTFYDSSGTVIGCVNATMTYVGTGDRYGFDADLWRQYIPGVTYVAQTDLIYFPLKLSAGLVSSGRSHLAGWQLSFVVSQHRWLARLWSLAHLTNGHQVGVITTVLCVVESELAATAADRLKG